MTTSNTDWDIDNNRPVFIQIMEIIQNRIASGFYAPGEKIPSVREIAAEATVNPNTVQRSLLELERTELLLSKRAIGRFVTEDESIIAQTRSQLAIKIVDAFFEGMTGLGFSKQEAIAMLDERGGEL